MSFIWFEAESSLWLGMWMDSGRAEVLLVQVWVRLGPSELSPNNPSDLVESLALSL